jgi:hypothetical protein
MQDATYVVVALALCMLVLLVFSLNKPRPQSMMDMAEFKHLPSELRAAIRRMLPDPAVIRQRWASMTPDQKQMVIQQVSGVIPQPRPPQPVQMPEPTLEPEPEPVPVIETVPEPVAEASPLKKGFLLGDAKKKNTKDKKKNKEVTLGSVAPEDNASSDGFLGSDQ